MLLFDVLFSLVFFGRCHADDRMLPSCRSQEAWAMFFLFHSFLGTTSRSCVIHLSLKVNKQAATMSHWHFLSVLGKYIFPGFLYLYMCVSTYIYIYKPAICPNIDSSGHIWQGIGMRRWDIGKIYRDAAATWSLIKIPERIIWLLLAFRLLPVPVKTVAAFKQI